jgi:hypothetical protein
MDPRSDDAVVRVFSQVLEDFAFLYGDAVTRDRLPAFPGAGYLASIPFRGPLSGGIALGVPAPLALVIAANTLGADPYDPEVRAKAPDAVREVVSVLGGHLASALSGMESPETLAPPALESVGPAEWQRLQSDPRTLCFSVNDQPVLFRVDAGREGADR